VGVIVSEWIERKIGDLTSANVPPSYILIYTMLLGGTFSNLRSHVGLSTCSSARLGCPSDEPHVTPTKKYSSIFEHIRRIFMFKKNKMFVMSNHWTRPSIRVRLGHPTPHVRLVKQPCLHASLNEWIISGLKNRTKSFQYFFNTYRTKKPAN
jgi:hypothetical protein